MENADIKQKLDDIYKDAGIDSEEIVKFMEYLRGLEFENLNDTAEFCKEWAMAWMKDPDNKMLAMKYNLICRTYFHQFLKAFFEAKMMFEGIDQMMQELVGEVLENKEQGNTEKTASGVPKVKKTIH